VIERLKSLQPQKRRRPDPIRSAVLFRRTYAQSLRLVLHRHLRAFGLANGREQIALALKPFGQVCSSRARRQEGTGLGLPIAKALIEEVLPQVEKNYHAAKDREHRAIAGLSMGGAESLYTGFAYLDHFAYIGSFSGAFVMWPRANPAPAQPAAPQQPRQQ